MAKKQKSGGRRRGEEPAWGGRYRREPAELTQRFTESISFDRRLWREDLAGSAAHAAMLRRRGLLSAADEKRIQAGLRRIGREIESGRFAFRADREDIHLNVEARLAEIAGEAGRRLHTARSRNDQVALDLRLWLRRTAAALDLALAGLQRALVGLARRSGKVVIPGYTHLRPAMPLLAAHYALALVEAFERDRGRLADLAARANVSPLGACALAGTGLPIDCAQTARALGFAASAANSLDAVGDRDFLLEFLAAAGIAGLHLTRLAEDWIIFSGPEFGLLRLPEEFTTGSSIMPHKANPDVLELIRARGARLAASFNELALLLKGLPSGYNRDLQEDKRVAFAAADSLGEALEAAAALAAGVAFDPAAGRRALARAGAEAIVLVEHLVRRGVPFRDAHRQAGRMVRLAEESGRALAAIPAAELRREGLDVGSGVGRELGCDRVDHYRSAGSSAPAAVARQLRRWEKRLGRGR